MHADYLDDTKRITDWDFNAAVLAVAASSLLQNFCAVIYGHSKRNKSFNYDAFLLILARLEIMAAPTMLSQER